MKRILIVLAGLALAAGSRAESINLGGGKAVHFLVPETWVATETAAPGTPEAPQAGKELRYIPKSGSNDAVLITVLLVPDDRFSDRESLRLLVAEATQRFVTDSVEGKAFIKELRTPTAIGYSATFTDINLVDKPPVKDDYKTMTACFIYMGDKVMVCATIFSDDPAGPAFAEGLRVVKSVTLATPKDAI